MWALVVAITDRKEDAVLCTDEAVSLDTITEPWRTLWKICYAHAY